MPFPTRRLHLLDLRDGGRVLHLRQCVVGVVHRRRRDAPRQRLHVRRVHRRLPQLLLLQQTTRQTNSPRRLAHDLSRALRMSRAASSTIPAVSGVAAPRPLAVTSLVVSSPRPASPPPSRDTVSPLPRAPLETRSTTRARARRRWHPQRRRPLIHGVHSRALAPRRPRAGRARRASTRRSRARSVGSRARRRACAPRVALCVRRSFRRHHHHATTRATPSRRVRRVRGRRERVDDVVLVARARRETRASTRTSTSSSPSPTSFTATYARGVEYDGALVADAATTGARESLEACECACRSKRGCNVFVWSTRGDARVG